MKHRVRIRIRIRIRFRFPAHRSPLTKNQEQLPCPSGSSGGGVGRRHLRVGWCAAAYGLPRVW